MSELEHSSELVDSFRLTGDEKGENLVRLGQHVPPGVACPKDGELMEWGLVLRAESTESALLESQKRMWGGTGEGLTDQPQSDDLRTRLDLDASSLETLNMLALVANKTDNLVMILDRSGCVE
jgi:hypothetical protein